MLLESFPGLVLEHLATFIICISPLVFLHTSLSESNSTIFIFFLSKAALSIKSFGSPIETIGILRSSHSFEEDNLMIKSGPIPLGSPGE